MDESFCESPEIPKHVKDLLQHSKYELRPMDCIDPPGSSARALLVRRYRGPLAYAKRWSPSGEGQARGGYNTFVRSTAVCEPHVSIEQHEYELTLRTFAGQRKQPIDFEQEVLSRESPSNIPTSSLITGGDGEKHEERDFPVRDFQSHEDRNLNQDLLRLSGAYI